MMLLYFVPVHMIRLRTNKEGNTPVEVSSHASQWPICMVWNSDDVTRERQGSTSHTQRVAAISGVAYIGNEKTGKMKAMEKRNGWRYTLQHFAATFAFVFVLRCRAVPCRRASTQTRSCILFATVRKRV